MAYHCRRVVRAYLMDCRIYTYAVFYQFYQLGQEDDNDGEDESDGEKESGGGLESSHSLFGVLWSLQKETGFTHHYLLWGEPWCLLMLKIADAPKYKTKKQKDKVDTTNEDTAEKALLDFFNENNR